MLLFDAMEIKMGGKATSRKPGTRWASRIGGGGRVVIPAEIRKTLDLKEGDLVMFEDNGSKVTLMPYRDVVRSIQRKYAARLRDPKFSVDAFLAQRRTMWGED